MKIRTQHNGFARPQAKNTYLGFGLKENNKVPKTQANKKQIKDPKVSIIEKQIKYIDEIKKKLPHWPVNIRMYKEKNDSKYSNTLVTALNHKKGVEILHCTLDNEKHVFFAFRDNITINDYKLDAAITDNIKSTVFKKSIEYLDGKKVILEKKKQELILLQNELEQEQDQENQQYRANSMVVDLSKKNDSKISFLDTKFHAVVPNVNTVNTWITEEEGFDEGDGGGNVDESFFDDEDYSENLSNPGLIYKKSDEYIPPRNTIEHNTNQHRESDVIYSSEAKPPREDLLMSDVSEFLSLLFNEEDTDDFLGVYKKIDNFTKKINLEEVSIDIFEDKLKGAKIEETKASTKNKSNTIPKEISKISIKKDEIINQSRDVNKSRDSISTKKERNKVIGHNYHYSSISYADRSSEMYERLRNIYAIIYRILSLLKSNPYHKRNIEYILKKLNLNKK
jgi:hypothetical protein